MTNLPMPVPLDPSHFIHRMDLATTLRGIPDGLYRTADLYPRYAEAARQAGRKVAPAKTLGEALGRVLGRSSRRGHGNVAVWEVGTLESASFIATAATNSVLDPWV